MIWRPQRRAVLANVPRPRPPGARFYGWHRHFNGSSCDPRWKLVANTVGASRAVVFHVVMYMREHANQPKPRGSFENFRSDVCAVAIEQEAGLVESMKSALRQIGSLEGAQD